MGVCNCSMFCMSILVCNHFDGEERAGCFAYMCSLSSWCLMIVVWLFLAMQWVCQQIVIVAMPDLTYLLFLNFTNGASGLGWKVHIFLPAHELLVLVGYAVKSLFNHVYTATCT